MNCYLKKYVGTYRVKAEVDQRTNDFCRDENGNLENGYDVWIECANKIRIYHYGGSTLILYCPTKQRGRNIIRELYAKYINPDNAEIVVRDINISKENTNEVKATSYKIKDNKLYKEDMAKKGNIIFNISETDEEVIFRFKDKDMDKIAAICKPHTSGAGISPFSTKNLPKKNNILSNEQIKEYKEITKNVSTDNMLKISLIQKNFINNIMAKKEKIKSPREEMKFLLLDGRSYISHKGYWNEYMKYLDKELKNIL